MNDFLPLRSVRTEIVPAPLAAVNQVMAVTDHIMVLHLHINNTAVADIEVELHIGDPSLPILETLFANFTIPANSNSTPLYNIALQPGTRLWVRPSDPDTANVVVSYTSAGGR